MATHDPNLDWTITEIANLDLPHPIPRTTIEKHLKNGTLPHYKDHRNHHRITEQNGANYINNWAKEAKQFTGEQSKYIATPEIRKRWGTSPAIILNTRGAPHNLDTTTLCDETAWNRQEFYDHAEQRGYIELALANENLKPCLHTNCNRPAKQQPEGYGIRFCPTHLPAWERIRDHPSTRSVALASEKTAA